MSLKKPMKGFEKYNHKMAMFDHIFFWIGTIKQKCFIATLNHLKITISVAIIAFCLCYTVQLNTVLQSLALTYGKVCEIHAAEQTYCLSQHGQNAVQFRNWW